MQKVVIVDYEVGNLFNVQQAVEHFGIKPIVSGNPADIDSADRVILPGVGAFNVAMEKLRTKKLAEKICDYAFQGKHLLGICLGMQLLMSESEEFGFCKGLDIIKGNVKCFTKKPNDNLKIPQYGWNTIEPKNYEPSSQNDRWDTSILKNIKYNSSLFFVHSYFVNVVDDSNTFAVTKYGHDVFTSVVKNVNVVGCQFHPERSGRVGLSIINNFLIAE